MTKAEDAFRVRLFDTTFIVDLVSKGPGAGTKARQVDEERSFAAVSVITVHEYFLGVYNRYLATRELR